MPIVFVHGVNNEDGEEYGKSEAARNGFLQGSHCPALGLSADDVYLTSPYWGTCGAQFAWGMAVLPDQGGDFEVWWGYGSGSLWKSGNGAPSPASALADGGTICRERQEDFAGVVDILYASALAGAKTESQSRDIARSYLIASAYAEEPHPEWLANALETNFVDQLGYHADASKEESFGKGDTRFTKRGPFPASECSTGHCKFSTTRLARRQLNTTVTRFAGDAFTYLARRGTRRPGEIVKIVLDALRDAASKKSPKDNRLIVIGHSFGGEMIDILTHFDTALK